jgi:hypothetical protein
MGIIRVVKNRDFVVMNKTALLDHALSWKAKGLHAYMLSMPDDWTFYNNELVKHAKDGRDSFRSAIKELQEAGYVKRFPQQNKDGTFDGWETVVYEYPQGDSTEIREISKSDNPKLLNNKTTKELKELNNKDIYIQLAEFVKMKESEYNKLIEEHGKPLTDKMIQVLDNYKGANGKKYKSDYRAILNWVVDKVKGVKNERVTKNSRKTDSSEYDGLSL